VPNLQQRRQLTLRGGRAAFADSSFISQAAGKRRSDCIEIDRRLPWRAGWRDLGRRRLQRQSALPLPGLNGHFAASGNCTVTARTYTLPGAVPSLVPLRSRGTNQYKRGHRVPPSFTITKSRHTITFCCGGQNFRLAGFCRQFSTAVFSTDGEFSAHRQLPHRPASHRSTSPARDSCTDTRVLRNRGLQLQRCVPTVPPPFAMRQDPQDDHLRALAARLFGNADFRGFHGVFSY